MKMLWFVIVTSLLYVVEGQADFKGNWCGPLYLIHPNKHCRVENSHYNKLKKETFSNLPTLKIVILYGIVKILQPSCFSTMQQLEDVYLLSGSINHIKNDVFTNLNLYEVSLEKNQIKNIDDKAFARMSKLRTLNLSDNKIEQVGKSWFEGSSIETLLLRRNHITQLHCDTFLKLTTGDRIFLSENKIRSIENGTFTKFRHVRLDSNLLSEGNFLDNTRLEFMSLANNTLKYIKLTRHTIINEIEVYSNPWICECLLEFWRMVKSRNTKVLVTSAAKINAAICTATIKSCPYL